MMQGDTVVVLIVLYFGVDFVMFAPYARFHILTSVRETEWPPIRHYSILKIIFAVAVTGGI